MDTNIEQRAREAFEQQARGWRNAPSWEELHDDTRQHWRDWVARKIPPNPEKSLVKT